MALAMNAICGYYDQPHFVREFAEFPGSTPSEFLKRWRPESNGVIAD